MISLIAGAVLLSIVHALIPNHWIPFVMLGKTERWSKAETLAIALVAGFAHTLSTVLIGILIGFAGVRLSAAFHHFSSYVAPTVLVIIGLVYLSMGLRGGSHHHHDHGDVDSKKKSKLAVVVTLGLAMFFSPCLEIEAYYLTAAGFGWIGIILVSITYMMITVSGIVLMTYLGLISIKRLKWHFLDHHERTITGGILTALGGLAFFVHF